MTRQHGGNAAWKELSDDCPGDLRRRKVPAEVHADGFTRTDCAVCGHWTEWRFGLIRHDIDGHVIYHVKIPAHTVQHLNGGTLTSMIVDGKAQA